MDVPAKNGPPPGFRELYEGELDRTWRVLARLGVPDASIEDALQDVFVTAYRSWYRLRDPSLRHAWLMGIARRVAFRHRRAQSRHARKLDAFGAVLAEQPAGPDAALQIAEARARLREFIDALDGPRRDAFVLGELEELDRKQLGAVLGINPNTAYSRLASARREFVRCFGAEADAIARDGREERAPEPVRVHAWLVISTSWGSRAPPIAIAGATKWALTAAVVVGGGLAVTRPRAEPAGHVAVVQAATVELAAPPIAAPAIIAAHVPAPIVEAPAEPTAPARVEPRRSTRPIVPEVAPETAVARAPIEGIDAESDLLARARKAAVDGEHDTAQRLLDEHRRRFGASARMGAIRSRIAAQLGTPRASR
ncbi:MAG TPA: sigma-70 family RNA polymerase sigma factor [Nannocystaceae bacterium]|nr:sigma-70 family RNA polymerase sigma factor [Nannocystaceae bacterium]